MSANPVSVPPERGAPTWSISLPDGWKVSDLQTWRMRLCEHPTGAMAVFMEDRVVIHRSDNAQGREAAKEIEVRLLAAEHTVATDSPDHPTVIYTAPESGRL